jgi:hypothetical protein
MCSLPLCEGLLSFVFVFFHAHFLGTLCFLLAIVNLYKYWFFKRIEIPEDMKIVGMSRPIYLVRVLNWTVFGASWMLFTILPLTEARALLRIGVAFIILSEVLYNWYWISKMFKRGWEWTRSWLR